jgi:RimJ/RimL family protein N-acetyltransferase
MDDIALNALKEDSYRMGNLQAVRYNRHNTEMFHEGFLGELYFLAKASRRRTGPGILDTLFGGNPESSFDSIVSYLANRPLVIIGEWKEEGFVPAGFGFVVVFCGAEQAERAAFCGYGLFKDYWGKEEGRILLMLGMAMIFNEFNLKAVHGTRFEDNLLTAKFTSQFGFEEVGRIPDYQLKDGKLVPAVVTSLSRARFEKYVEEFLVAQYRVAAPPQPAAEEAPKPAEPPEPPQLNLSWL